MSVRVGAGDPAGSGCVGGTCNGTGTHVKPVRAFQDVRPAAVGSVAVHEPRWCARGRGGAPGRRAAGGAAGQDVQHRAGRRAGQGEGRPGPAAAVQGAARRRRDAGEGRRGPGYRARRGDGADRGGRGLALHAAAFNGMPDPVLHRAARAMGVVTGLAALEPGPRPRRRRAPGRRPAGRHRPAAAPGLPA